MAKLTQKYCTLHQQEEKHRCFQLQPQLRSNVAMKHGPYTHKEAREHGYEDEICTFFNIDFRKVLDLSMPCFLHIIVAPLKNCENYVNRTGAL